MLEVVARDGIEPSTRGFSVQGRGVGGAKKPRIGKAFPDGRPNAPPTEPLGSFAGPSGPVWHELQYQYQACGAWRHTLHSAVTRSFRHRGVERFFRTGSKAGIQAAHAPRLARQLAALNVARQPSDMNVPGWGLHPLKGKLSNHWSVSVSGNWRLTFTFIDGDAEFVDYQDYH